MEETKEAQTEVAEVTEVKKKKKKKKKFDLIPDDKEEKLKKQWHGFWAEFKTFISKGNMLDMAIAVVIGSAFSKIITSIVNDLITPVITLLLGKQSLSELSIVLRPATETEVALTWNYGNFIQTLVDFLIVALCLFIVLKAFLKAQTGFRKLTKKEKKELKEEGKEVPKEVVVEQPKETADDILKDIRELLKVQNGVSINMQDKKD